MSDQIEGFTWKGTTNSNLNIKRKKNMGRSDSAQKALFHALKGAFRFTDREDDKGTENGPHPAEGAMIIRGAAGAYLAEKDVDYDEGRAAELYEELVWQKIDLTEADWPEEYTLDDWCLAWGAGQSYYLATGRNYEDACHLAIYAAEKYLEQAR